MKTVFLKSPSKAKIELLVKVAREMGVETYTEDKLTAEEMALPGPKVSSRQLERWLAEGDGDEEYTTEELLSLIKKDLSKSRKRKNEGRL